jgi:hypothetical protein
MAYSLGFLGFLTFLYRYKNSDKPRSLRLSDSSAKALKAGNWTYLVNDRLRCGLDPRKHSAAVGYGSSGAVQYKKPNDF